VEPLFILKLLQQIVVGTAYTAQASFTTLKAEPSNFPTSFACGTTTTTTIPLTWTDATGLQPRQMHT
jgi:hypothetical protein